MLHLSFVFSGFNDTTDVQSVNMPVVLSAKTVKIHSDQ